MPRVLEFRPLFLTLALSLVLTACVEVEEAQLPGSPAPISTGSPNPTGDSDPGDAQPEVNAKPSPEESSRFLMAASFGPTLDSIEDLTELGYSGWVTKQIDLPMRSIVDASWSQLEPLSFQVSEHTHPLSYFYSNAIEGEDQLRMRATYALSQVLVVSTADEDVASNGEGLARYMDILQEGAFGNYRQLLEEVTYSPTMGTYLTYIGSKKADETMGAAPDENYAREILQLFSIGLVELNPDGSPKLNELGQTIETYTNADIMELSKVFTGLWWEGLPFGRDTKERSQSAQISRMVMHLEQHSEGPKKFLGRSIPEDVRGDEAISMALDIIFEHPNTAPFVSKRLIQRLTTSNPSAEYVRRVSNAFESGEYTFSDGTVVGSGNRGDLSPVWAAILMDPEFLQSEAEPDITFGKLKEPFVRFVHWARVADVFGGHFKKDGRTIDTVVRDHHLNLGQRPFTSPSVFNFYDADYVRIGSMADRAQLVAPEMEITTTSAVIEYANHMRRVVFRDSGATGHFGDPLDIVGRYSYEIDLADDTQALVDHLDLLFAAGEMSLETRYEIGMAIESIQLSDSETGEQLRDRVQLAMLLAVVSPDFIVQR
ncbi:MAG: DUF1800 family protein [Pseudomonadota bacterium]